MEHKKKTINLSELSTNKTVQNDLFENVASWLVDSSAESSVLIGTKKRIETVTAVMAASKKFQNELSNPTATLTSINEKLDLKHQAANSFFEVFGVKWVF